MDDELKEEDFIQDASLKSPNPFLLGLFFLAVALVIVSGFINWFKEHQKESRKIPFYQVTNRQFELFIWDNPRFHTQNVSADKAYLPGLKYIENINNEKADADETINVPNHILFEYHSWKRLLDYPPFKRPIPLDEFKRFLKEYDEWMPKFWKEAPISYVDIIQRIDQGETLEHLEDHLPNDVQKAFTGWKNFTLEKNELENFKPTYGLLKEFLKKYPNYSRNYWINIIKKGDPTYLETISFGQANPKSVVPNDEMAPFLQISLFNYSKTPNPS